MRVIDNFFPIAATIALYSGIEKLLQKKVWGINRTCWQSTLTDHYDGAVYYASIDEFDNIENHPKAFEIKDKIQTAFDKTIDWDSSRLLIHVWDYGSGINWHSDSHCDFGMTIYLNHTWEKHWGGIFKYIEGDEVKEIFPAPGKCIVNDNSTWHSVTKLTTRNPQRFTLQLFGNFKNEETIQK